MTAAKRSRLRQMHKVFGLTAAIGLLWLSLSGLLLVWGDSLSLAQRPLPGWLGRVYGTAATNAVLKAEQHSLGFDGHWQFDGRPVAVALHAPRLFLAGPGGLYYAMADDGLALFMADGSLVESLPAASFGSRRLSRAGGDEHQVCAGDTALRCTQDGAEWHAAGSGLPPLASVAAAAADLPSVERLVLDLHAGRFLGPFKTAVWTLFSVALLFLAWSGLRLALGKRRKTGDG